MPVSPQRYPARREALQRLLSQQQLTAVLVSDETNVRYLTGFTGDSTWLLIGNGLELVLSDGRFTTQLEEECPDLKKEIRSVKETLPQATGRLLSGLGLTDCGFESTALSYELANQLKDHSGSCQFRPVKNLVEQLRVIKDEDEIEEIRQAIIQAETGFNEFKASLKPEMTELEMAFSLEAEMRKAGSIRASFEIIAAVGPRAALPHARPGKTRCQESPFVLIDWGSRSPSGYISDLTRMIVTGSISPEFERLYEVVRASQEAALKTIAPGVKSGDVDRSARQVMEAAGVADKFNHSLGHGIGLQVHEAIRLGPACEETLKPGMVVTVEPGVYLPGWGGIRIEDDVLVTEDGCTILSSLPKYLESCLTIC